MAQEAPLFRAPDPGLADRVSLDAVSEPPAAPAAPSPYGTRNLWAVFPDFTQNGPWSTTFVIGPPSGEGNLLRLSLARHANVHPLATWINEEILHVRVWWGRIAGSDLLVDVPRRELLYHRMFFFPADLPAPAPPPAGED